MRYYDNTRISAYKKCPRYFYFRHIQGWTVRRPGAALVFGLSWHAALDAMWRHASHGASRNTCLAAAREAFHKCWVEQGYSEELDYEQETSLAPRTPGVADELLASYIEKRWKLMTSAKLLGSELPFAVPVKEGAPFLYVGRLDKKIEWEGSIWVVEHKTTTAYRKEGYFKQDFINSFSPNSQVDGYIHHIHAEHGGKARGVLVDATLVHKTVYEGHKLIPVEKGMGLLSLWLIEVNNWIQRIETELNLLHQCRDTHQEENLKWLFPKNDGACWDYGSMCIYHTICRFEGAPHLLTEPPEGLVLERWEPYKLLGLEQLDLKDEE